MSFFVSFKASSFYCLHFLLLHAQGSWHSVLFFPQIMPGDFSVNLPGPLTPRDGGGAAHGLTSLTRSTHNLKASVLTPRSEQNEKQSIMGQWHHSLLSPYSSVVVIRSAVKLRESTFCALLKYPWRLRQSHFPVPCVLILTLFSWKWNIPLPPIVVSAFCFLIIPLF